MHGVKNTNLGINSANGYLGGGAGQKIVSSRTGSTSSYLSTFHSLSNIRNTRKSKNYPKKILT